MWRLAESIKEASAWWERVAFGHSRCVSYWICGHHRRSASEQLDRRVKSFACFIPELRPAGDTTVACSPVCAGSRNPSPLLSHMRSPDNPQDDDTVGFQPMFGRPEDAP